MRSKVFLSLFCAASLATFSIAPGFAARHSLLMEANPQTVGLGATSTITLRLTRDGKPLPKTEIFVGLTGIGGTLSPMMVITDANGVGTTIFTAPKEPSEGLVIAKANIRDGDGIISIQSALNIEVEDLNAPPESFIDTVFPFPGRTDEAVMFEGHATDKDNAVVSWEWDFGDGAKELGSGNNSKVSHSYAKAGTYKVTFTAIDETGALSDPPVVNLRIVDNKPPSIKSIGEWPKVARIESKIAFEAELADTESRLSSLEVNFGDGVVDKIPVFGDYAKVKFEHVYTSRGVFTLTCKVFDDFGEGTAYPPGGWPVTVEGLGLGGIKLLVQKASGRVVQIIGPLPLESMAFQETLMEWGLETGPMLEAGDYKIVGKDNRFGLSGIPRVIHVNAGETLTLSAELFEPTLSSKIVVRSDQSLRIELALSDQKGPLSLPAIVWIKQTQNLLPEFVVLGSDGKASLPVKGVIEEGSQLLFEVWIDDILATSKLAVSLPKPLPYLDIQATHVGKYVMLNCFAPPEIEGKGEVAFKYTVTDLHTNKTVPLIEALTPMPEKVELSFIPLKLALTPNTSERGRFMVCVEVSFAVSPDVTLYDMLELDPCALPGKLNILWGHDGKDVVNLHASYVDEASGRPQPCLRFKLSYAFEAPIGWVPKTAAPVGLPSALVASKDGFAKARLDVGKALSGFSVMGLKVTASCELAGLTYKTEFVIPTLPAAPKVVFDVLAQGTVKLLLLDGEGNAVPGAWLDCLYELDGNRLSGAQLKTIGNPPVSVRTSMHGNAILPLIVPKNGALTVYCIATIGGNKINCELSLPVKR